MKLFCVLLWWLSLAISVSAQVPSFKSFNTNQFSTNNFIVSIKDGAITTNITIRNSVSLPSGPGSVSTISNIFDLTLWTNNAGVLQPTAGTSVLVTNLTSIATLISQGSFRLPITSTVQLNNGTNCVNPVGNGTLGIIGDTGLFSDSSMTLESGVAGDFMVLLNNDPTNDSGFTIFDGIDLCDGSGGFIRLNGDWITEQYGDGLVMYFTGLIWTEVGRFFGTTNTVIDGVWQYVGGIIKPVSEDTERIRIDGTGGISVGSTAFPAGGATLISIRDTAAGDADYNELYLKAVDGSDTSEIDFYLDSSDINVSFTADGVVTTLLNPTVFNAANAVSYRFGSSRFLNASGALLAAFPNAQTNVYTFGWDGQLNIGRGSAAQFSSLQSITAFVDTSLGETTYPAITIGSTDGGSKYRYADLSANTNDTDYVSLLLVGDGNRFLTVLNPTVPSGGGTAYKLDSFSTLTNGDTFVSIENATVPIFKFQPGPSGNPAGQITFGPGSTNVLYRDGAHLIYTNGTTTGYSIKMSDPGGSGLLASYGVLNGGGAKVSVGTGQGIFLAPDNESISYVAQATAFGPSALNASLGTSASTGRWLNLHLDNNISWNGTTNNLIDTWGTATPEGSETARPGSLFRDTANGNLYLKTSGTGNTGWTLIGGATGGGVMYDQLIHPHRADQVGAVMLTSDPSSVNYGHALFSGTAATNANFIEYRWQVPKNINTSVDLQASWSVMLNAADTSASTYTIGMASVAASSSYASPTLGNYVTLTVAADASGAQNDYETVQDVTLTGWAAALTAGNVFVIRVARDGAGDTSNVAHYDAGLTIKYGTQ